MSIEQGKNLRVSIQHASNVLQIWRTCDLGIDIASIQDHELISQYWVENVRTTMQPGTIKSYLCSLKEFISFLQVVHPQGWDETKCSALLAAIGRWSNTIGRECRKRAIQRAVIDNEEQVTPEHLNACLNSDLARLSKEYLLQVSSGDLTRLSMHQYTLGRNFIMLYILASNAQRSGVISNMTLRTFRHAALKENNYVLTVASHKTGYQTPATLILANEAWMFLKAYYKMRKLLINYDPEFETDNSPMCLAWSKSKEGLNTSEVNKAIRAFWSESCPDSPAITATIIRKSAVTNIRREHPELREALSSHMTHRPTTADNYIHEKSSESIKVTGVISSVMLRKSTDLPVSEDQGPAEHDGVRVNPDEKNVIFEEHGHPPDIETDNFSLHSWEESRSSSPAPIESGSKSPTKHGRRAFSKEDAHILLTLCQDMVEGKIPLTQKDIKTSLLLDIDGKRLLESGAYNIKQLADRVRTARKAYEKAKKAKYE